MDCSQLNQIGSGKGFSNPPPMQMQMPTGVMPAQSATPPPRPATPLQAAAPTARPVLPTKTLQTPIFRPTGQMMAEGGAAKPSTVTKFHVGPIHSTVAGRTDHLPMTVPSGSYVLPADILSGLGEGNTMAGYKHMRRIFAGNPYAQGKSPYGQNSGPYGEPIERARGGSVLKASGIMFVDPEDRVLLMKRAGKDHGGEWAFPGGGIEQDETPREAARREVEEETGHAYDGSLGMLGQRLKDGVHFTTYKAHVDPFAPKLNDEHSEHKWVKVRQALEMPLHPGVRETLERVKLATGGATHDGDEGVPIVAAGGEYVLSPEEVLMAGDGDMETGHKVLDQFVRRMRAQTVKTLSNLPGPKQS